MPFDRFNERVTQDKVTEVLAALECGLRDRRFGLDRLTGQTGNVTVVSWFMNKPLYTPYVCCCLKDGEFFEGTPTNLSNLSCLSDATMHQKTPRLMSLETVHNDVAQCGLRLSSWS